MSRFKRRWKPELPSLKGADLIGLDIETYDPFLKELGTGVRRNGHMVGLSVAIKREDEYKAWYIPCRHKEGLNIEPEKVIEWAKEELSNPKQEKILSNCLYDLDYLAHEKVTVNGRINDIQNAEPIINENQRRFGLEAMSKKYLGIGKYEDELDNYCKRIFGDKVNTKAQIHRLPSDIVREYAEVDAINPLKIFEKQIEEIKKQGLEDIYNLECDLVPILLEMKRNGIRVNTERAKVLDKEYAKIIKENKERLNELAGYEVNFNASASIALYCDKHGIEYPLTAKTKKPSFTKPWMENRDEEFFELVTQLKQDYKLSGSFVEGVVLKYAVNGRVHCQLNQLKGDQYGTVSGRFSSSLPNLQQIPSPEKALGPLIRSLFLPEIDEEWVCCDYKQIEPRLTLHYARGQEAEAARQFLRDNPDEDSYKPMMNAIYSYICKLVPESSIDVQSAKFKKEHKDTTLTEEEIREKVRYNLSRKKLKIIQLGSMYGQGERGLIKKLGLSPKEGRDTMSNFHKLLPYVKQLSESVKNRAESRGYVKTILGRKRRFDTYEPRGNYGTDRYPDLPYDEAVEMYGHNIVRAFCYKALNSVIQGGSADMIKKAMIDVKKSGVLDHCRMLLTVHDELDFSIPKTKIGQECKKEIKYMMEHVVELRVPTRIDMECGSNWGELI